MYQKSDLPRIFRKLGGRVRKSQKQNEIRKRVATIDERYQKRVAEIFKLEDAAERQRRLEFIEKRRCLFRNAMSSLKL